jgi:hypothetical protein
MIALIHDAPPYLLSIAAAVCLVLAIWRAWYGNQKDALLFGVLFLLCVFVVNFPLLDKKETIPWILALATAVIGIFQFTEQQREANRRPFLQKQLDLCFQATETASRLASETDPTKWEEARITFWRLYWGPLSVVEDPAVESAMVDLGRLVPDHVVHAPELPMRSLGVPSYRLAHAVRKLVLASWNVDLPPLDGARESQT